MYSMGQTPSKSNHFKLTIEEKIKSKTQDTIVFWVFFVLYEKLKK